ncbi:regulatory helix-turn-helix protein, lysR family [Streptomyces sp. ScaeMP-6W]|nr:LysR family transcriptional regulator [Streptomyces sp. ScaeMP-6W]SCE45411.1 regulatory helix-turn-helix protein, lysR family [Streptomyces sp. ScaeMP-6W]
MNVTAVRTFVAVVDAGQFQDAAADLSVTPQAVSKRVAALEKELGVRSWSGTRGVRGSPSTGRRSSLTPAGCSGPPSGPSPRCGRAAGRCAST